jgi:asparagine synthase (glutamine-hydrolysing)
MCGISGIVKLHGRSPEPQTLRDMIGTLTHRGPDGSETHCEGSAGLAHARLSIIDLAGGKQPMSIAGGRLWITFNGEIFNYVELREGLLRKGHKFATRSDTEVILHLYQEEGEDCVQRLNGQWSFAIWDADAQKLFLSRDRMGVRPLFYTRTAGSFLFASEIKALLDHPDVEARLDLCALDQIFTFWTTLPPRTAFKNISQLPPGHSAVLEDHQFRVWPYWRLEYVPEDGTECNNTQLTQDLLDLLLDATRIRLRSDVPVGAYLSGGLDSTFITALTNSLVGDKLRTFSVSFEDAEFDESAYQREASAFFGSRHSDVRCTNEDVATIFPEVIRHTEQPILRTAPAPMYLLAKLVHESGFKVVLTGEGADETMGGYDIFKEAKIRRFWSRNPQSRMRPLLLKRLYPYMDGIQRQPTAYLKHFFHISERELASPLFSHLPRWELTAKLKTLFSREVKAELHDYDAQGDLECALPKSFGSWDFFNQAEYLEAIYLLPGYILSSQGDRMAMAHSVEARYPFLDYRVVEFAAKLPPHLKMKVLDQKHLLKQAASGRIPDSIQRRPKQPYRAPDGAFFSSQFDYVDEMLSEDRITDYGVFDPQAVSALAAKFRSGHASSVKDNMALVGVLSTQLLLDHFVHHRNQGHSLCQPVSQQTSVASL